MEDIDDGSPGDGLSVLLVDIVPVFELPLLISFKSFKITSNLLKIFNDAGS